MSDDEPLPGQITLDELLAGSVEGPVRYSRQPRPRLQTEKSSAGTVTIRCRDYRAHQSRHRQIRPGFWICGVCDAP